MGAFLDKVLLASGEGGRSGDELGDEDRSDWDEADWDDVRQHLESQSPWFKKVMGGESPGEPDEAELAAIELTPRTAEASTVHEPTVPPGGPGLFHMKGHQLPAYVQHLYKHLVGKYGKHRAYGVAIGIVKKWAKGINPGGKGKGHKVHADVQAAAGKNIADWEKEKAEAHAHHAAEEAGHGHSGKDKAAASNIALAGREVMVRPHSRVERGRLEYVHGYAESLRRELEADPVRAWFGKKAMRELARAHPQVLDEIAESLADARESLDDGDIGEARRALMEAQWSAQLNRMFKTAHDLRGHVTSLRTHIMSGPFGGDRIPLRRPAMALTRLTGADLRQAAQEEVALSGEVELAAVRAFERDVQGRLERVNSYIRDDRMRVGVVDSPMAKSELTSLYRTSPEEESKFRGHLREARGHYAAGRHEEAAAALGRAQEIARAHSYGFTAEALGKQQQAVRAEKEAAAAKKAPAPEPVKKKRFGLFGKHPAPVAATGSLGRVLALAGGEVRSYQRRSPRGKLEQVTEYERVRAGMRPREPFKHTAVFDFDGVIHAGRGYHWPPHGKLDFAGIHEAHKRGYNVAVVTANDDWRVARELDHAGFHTQLDPQMKTLFWHGGPDGRTVLVTNRKVSGKAYIDDRAIHHAYGDNWGHTLDQIDRISAGFEPRPQDDLDRRRFGDGKVATTVPEGLDRTELSAAGDAEVLVWLAAPASWPSGKPYKDSLLPPGPTTGLRQGSQTRTGVIVNGPGSKPALYGQLRQAPAQTVSPSPPLPPGAKLPTPEDLEKLALSVPDGASEPHVNSIKTHLHAAAEKLRKNDQIAALSALRSAQTGVHAAYRDAYAANMPRTAEVYKVNSLVQDKTPPAWQSSVTNEMLAGRKLTDDYRKLHHQVSTHIDTLRRIHFHGMWQGMPEARMSGAPHLSKVLALAGEVHGYERHDKLGREVNVTGYLRSNGERFTGKLYGPEADEAIRKGEARGEYGEPTGFFHTSTGQKMWGWHGAAGLLVRHTDEKGVHRYLLQKRAGWVEHGGTYSTPGGAMDTVEGRGETPVEAAHREAREEFGRELPEGTTHAETRSKTFGEAPYDWSYHTVIMDSPEQFDPAGSGLEGVHDTRNESRGYVWATPEEMAQLPLLPNFRGTAEELGMPKGGGTRAP